MFALVASVAFALGAGVVIAGSAYGSYNYFTINGKSYKARSSIHTDHANNHRAHASQNITLTSGGTVAAGWMGVQPARRNSSGGLLCTGTMTYNSVASSGIGASACTINNHSTYSAGGWSRAWAGTTYSTHGSFNSPNQNS